MGCMPLGGDPKVVPATFVQTDVRPATFVRTKLLSTIFYIDEGNPGDLGAVGRAASP
jgi:hypothetical protein